RRPATAMVPEHCALFFGLSPGHQHTLPRFDQCRNDADKLVGRLGLPKYSLRHGLPQPPMMVDPGVAEVRQGGPAQRAGSLLWAQFSSLHPAEELFNKLLVHVGPDGTRSFALVLRGEHARRTRRTS